MLAGQPWLDAPPLFHWVAALTGQVGTWLGASFADGARLANALFVALWLWGSADKPFRRIWRAAELPEALAIHNIRPPLRGLCLEDEFGALAKAQPGLVEVARDRGFVHWTYRR